jgi:hypothetical protein
VLHTPSINSEMMIATYYSQFIQIRDVNFDNMLISILLYRCSWLHLYCVNATHKQEMRGEFTPAVPPRQFYEVIAAATGASHSLAEHHRAVVAPGMEVSPTLRTIARETRRTHLQQVRYCLCSVSVPVYSSSCSDELLRCSLMRLQCV